jgi:pyruvate kinase
VPGSWLATLQRDDVIHFVDARDSRRWMRVTDSLTEGCWAECNRTAYLTPGLQLEAVTPPSNTTRATRVGPIGGRPQSLGLEAGDRLVLTRSLEPGRPAQHGGHGEVVTPARIGVTLSAFFDRVRVGDPIWLDDGKFGGVVAEVGPDEVTVRIDQAPLGGAKLGTEKGINVPGTDLGLPALTVEDREALQFIARHADTVGYSFVRTEEDVRQLQQRLAELGAEHLGLVLKVETREGFENLPGLLFAAMRSRAVGVMIARGDLAVECGYERLAEVQEEILWIAEAAHVPVIWATQVLESLAKTGMPSRSEITDAAMGERAECVMLNKGPYVVEAVRTLDGILRRMQAHQRKKRSMLRQLRLATGFRDIVSASRLAEDSPAASELSARS